MAPDPKSNVVAAQRLPEDLWRGRLQMGLKVTVRYTRPSDSTRASYGVKLGDII
jgi:hypothetical protein